MISLIKKFTRVDQCDILGALVPNVGLDDDANLITIRDIRERDFVCMALGYVITKDAFDGWIASNENLAYECMNFRNQDDGVRYFTVYRLAMQYPNYAMSSKDRENVNTRILLIDNEELDENGVQIETLTHQLSLYATKDIKMGDHIIYPCYDGKDQYKTFLEEEEEKRKKAAEAAKKASGCSGRGGSSSRSNSKSRSKKDAKDAGPAPRVTRAQSTAH